MSLDEARRRLYNGNYFGSCMVVRGDADALVSGVNLHYPETIRPALEVIGAHPKARPRERHVHARVREAASSSAPTRRSTSIRRRKQLAQIAYSAARIARTIGVEPRIAMLSFSNFGSVRHPDTEKMARAVQLLRQRDPIAGRGRRDAGGHGVRPGDHLRDYPFSTLKEAGQCAYLPEP